MHGNTFTVNVIFKEPQRVAKSLKGNDEIYCNLMILGCVNNLLVGVRPLDIKIYVG